MPEQNEELNGIRASCMGDLRFLCKNVLGMNDWGKLHDDLKKQLDFKDRKKLILLTGG